MDGIEFKVWSQGELRSNQTINQTNKNQIWKVERNQTIKPSKVEDLESWKKSNNQTLKVEDLESWKSNNQTWKIWKSNNQILKVGDLESWKTGKFLKVVSLGS